MADFPAPQSPSAPGASAMPVTAGMIAYALFGIGAVLEVVRSGLMVPAPLLTILGIAAVVVCYVKRDDAVGTWVASHFTWLIRTFWWSLLWGIVGWVLYLLLVGALIWLAAAIWVIYRVIKGYLYYKDSRPIPASDADLSP